MFTRMILAVTLGLQLAVLVHFGGPSAMAAAKNPPRNLFVTQYNGSNVVTNPYVIIKQYDLNSVRHWVNYTYTRNGFIRPVVKWYVGNQTFKDAYNTNFGKSWHGKILKATVTDLYGSASIEKRIVFYYGPTIISPKFYEKFQAKGNTNFSVTVTYEGRPAVNRIAWDHKDVVIPNAVGDTLIIAPISRSDRGQYGVRVTNSENRSYRSVFTVDVHIPPTITAVAIDGTRLTSGDILTYGKTIKLEVIVKADTAAPYTVQCMVGEAVIYKGSNLTADITVGAWHGKQLTCMVSNEHGIGSISRKVVFYYPPSIITPHQGATYPAVAGTTFTLTALYDAHPPAHQVTWYFGREIIQNSTNATFQIDTVGCEHGGQYRVQVDNSEGSASVVFFVNAMCAPTFIPHPKQQNITAGNTSEIVVGFYSTPKYVTYKWTYVGDKAELHFRSDSRHSFIRKSKQDVVLAPYGETNMHMTSYEAVLVVNNPTEKSAGVYRLMVENGIGRSHTSVSVKVFEVHSEPQTTIPTTTPKVQEVVTQKFAGLGLPIVVGSIGGAVVLVVVVAIVVVCCVTKKYRTKRNTGAEGHVSYDNRGAGFAPDMHDRRDRPTPPTEPPHKMDWPTLHDSVYLEPETPENDYQLLRISLPALPTYEEFEPDEKI